MLPGVSFAPWWTNFSAFCPLSPRYLQTALSHPLLTFLLGWPLWSVKEPLLFRDTSSLLSVFLSLFSSSSFTGACSIQPLHASAFGGMESHIEVHCLPWPPLPPLGLQRSLWWQWGSAGFKRQEELQPKPCNKIICPPWKGDSWVCCLCSQLKEIPLLLLFFFFFLFFWGHHCSSATIQLYFTSCKKHLAKVATGRRLSPDPSLDVMCFNPGKHQTLSSWGKKVKRGEDPLRATAGTEMSECTQSTSTHQVNTGLRNHISLLKWRMDRYGGILKLHTRQHLMLALDFI